MAEQTRQLANGGSTAGLDGAHPTDSGKLVKNSQGRSMLARWFVVLLSLIFLAGSLLTLVLGLFRQCQEEVVDQRVISVCRTPAMTDPPVAWLSALGLVAVLLIANASISSVSFGGDKGFQVLFAQTATPNSSSVVVNNDFGPEVDGRGMGPKFKLHQVAMIRLLLLGAAAASHHWGSSVYCFYVFQSDKQMGYSWAATQRLPLPDTYDDLVGSQRLLDVVRAREHDENTSTDRVKQSAMGSRDRLCFFTPVRGREGETLGVLAWVGTGLDGQDLVRATSQTICAQLEATAVAIGNALSGSEQLTG